MKRQVILDFPILVDVTLGGTESDDDAVSVAQDVLGSLERKVKKLIENAFGDPWGDKVNSVDFGIDESAQVYEIEGSDDDESEDEDE
jgi:hypothetical protein